MGSFLYWIGVYNIFGALVLMGMHHEGFADVMMRRVTEIVAQPYRHGEWGRLWLWWAATTNLFVGGVMWRALSWPMEAQRDVVAGVLAVYGIMYGVLAGGGRGPAYGRGIVVVHGLWLGQLGWGAWALWAR